jgi:hypothetical protein
MKKRNHDEYWPPRPGSWEEAVDPYDVQWSEVRADTQTDDEQDVRIEVLSERRPQYNVPASAV